MLKEKEIERATVFREEKQILQQKNAQLQNQNFLTPDKASNSLVENLDNALFKLSEDIYSSNSHFILELIQNADDNVYTQNKGSSFFFFFTF